MKLNLLEFQKFFYEKFDGNYNKMARYMGLDVSHLHRILNNKSTAGTVFMGRIIKYCRKNNIDFDKFIIFQ